ncbi:glycosyltransferase family 2 protein [Ovoidimarina sediminis]|uniref:glycosyltransferase family 2 protein n=1 Tax=Ovoidimarina sediminis TaxID=3079856 RepID=UPI003977BF90
MRARRRRRDLMRAVDRTRSIRPDDILVFSTVRNEMIRLPYFLRYYRNLGARHFLIVDNGSTDGTADYLAEQTDVSLFHTNASYRRARYGIDWMNWLLNAYGHGHWCLTVDPDEFLIYPFCDTRPLPALTDWLQASAIRSFGTLLLDLYPKGPIDEVAYHAGQDPLEIAHWFDSGNYTIERNWRHRNLWIQGGPRARMFFADDPHQAPALNKIPLVNWDRRYAYVSGTHMLLPRGLNLTYDEWGGEKASGVLLHAKFLSVFDEKAREETVRREHYAEGREYRAYQARAKERPILWNRWSERYVNWRQLDALGLMSKGNWA